MNHLKCGLNIVVCMTLLSILFTGGCMSNGIAGTYTGINSPSNVIVLHNDGTMEVKNGAGSQTGNYTLTGTELILVSKNENGGTSALFTTMEPNGTFSIGMVTYRKNLF